MRFQFRVMYDSADATGASAGSGAPAAPAPATTVVPPSGSPAPASDPAPAAAAPKTYTYDNDRSQWIDPSRYGAMVRRAQEMEWRAAQIEKMMKAGTGLELPRMPTAEDRERDEARKFLHTLMPELKLLQDIKPEELQGIREFLTNERPRLAGGIDRMYARDGHVALDLLDSAVAQLYSTDVDKLDRDTRQEFTDMFVRWVERDPSRAALVGRGADRLVQDFIKQYTGRYVDPFRRAAQAPGAGQARHNASLPAAPRPSAAVPAGSAPAKPKTDEEVHDNAWKSFQAAMAGSR